MLALPTSPHLPSLSERPEAGHRRDGAAKHSTWLWVWGQQKLRSLQGPSAFTRLYPPHTHTHTPHSTHTSGGWGKHTVVPPGEVRRQGLWFLRATLPFPLSSPPLLRLLSPAGYVLHMWYDRQSHAALHIHLSVPVCVASSHVPWCSIKTGTRIWHS